MIPFVATAIKRSWSLGILRIDALLLTNAELNSRADIPSELPDVEEGVQFPNN